MIKETFTTRRLVLMALFVGMSAALSPLVIWLTPQQKLMSFQLLPLAVGSILFGPVAAVLLGIAADTVNYLIRPMGAYFPGFAISLAAACLFYSFWQYKRPIKLWRIALAHLCTVVFVYFGMNMFWMTLMYGQTAANFYTVTRLISNAVTFPFMVAAVFAMSKTAALIERRYVKKDGK